MTDERCRGCKMLGGHTIETEQEARAFTAAMRAHPAVWTPRDMELDAIRVGETIEIEPCVGPDYARHHGRECPRVELWPENSVAARLVFAALPEHTRGMLPAFVEALTSEMDPDEARAAVLRAVSTLHSEPVSNWLRAQCADPKDEG